MVTGKRANGLNSKGTRKMYGISIVERAGDRKKEAAKKSV